MFEGATWRYGDQWSQGARDEENAGGKERRSDTGVEGAVPGAIVLPVSCWRGRTEKTGGLWRITCLSLPLFSVIHSHVQDIHSGKWTSPPPTLHVGCYPYHPLLPLLFAPSRYKLPPQRQLEQVEGRPMQEEKNEEWRGRRKRRRKRLLSTPPKVRRSLQGQHTPHLSLGAREGYIERNRGERHTCPLGSSPLEEWGTN